MPTRPAAPPEWATNGGTRTVPTLARQGTGWAVGEPIDPKQCNDLWGEAFDWIGYLADIVPASNVVVAEVFRVVDPAGPTTRGALTWDTIGGNAGVAVGSTEGDKPGIFFDSVTGFVIVRQDAGVDLLEIREKGLVNPRGMADPTSGIRFGYDFSDTLQIVHPFGPGTGGWMAVTSGSTPAGEASPQIVPRIVAGAEFWQLYNPGSIALDLEFRRPLLFAAESSQASGFPVLKELSAVFDGASGAFNVTLSRINRATGAGSVVGGVSSMAPTNNFGGVGHTTTPLTHDYVLVLRAAGVAATTATVDAVRCILLKVNHHSLNPSIG